MKIFFGPKYLKPVRFNAIKMRALALYLFFIVFLTFNGAYAQTCAYAPSTPVTITGTYSNVDVLNGGSVNSTTTQFSITCNFDNGPKAGPAGPGPVGPAQQYITLCVQIGANTSSLLSDSSNRYLQKDTNSEIAHQLYTDSSFSTIWGSWGVGTPKYGSGGLTRVLNRGNGTTQTSIFTVYGKTTASPQLNPLKPANYNTAGSYTWSLNPAPVFYYFSGNTSTCAAAAAGSGSAPGPGPAKGPAASYKLDTSAHYLQFNATINAGCYISGSSNPLSAAKQNIYVDFGTVPVISADMTKAGTMYVQCTNGTSYIIGMGKGNSATGSGATLQRRLTNGTYFINYGLYTDSNYKIPWSDVVTGNVACSISGACLNGVATGTAVSLPVYVKIPFQTTPTAGTYTDTVVITINY